MNRTIAILPNTTTSHFWGALIGLVANKASDSDSSDSTALSAEQEARLAKLEADKKKSDEKKSSNTLMIVLMVALVLVVIGLIIWAIKGDK